MRWKRKCVICLFLFFGGDDVDDDDDDDSNAVLFIFIHGTGWYR